jgi:hypothetical protein
MGGMMSDGLLWDEMLVTPEKNCSVFVRVRRRAQSGPWQKFADASVHAFDHAVRLRVDRGG